MIRRCSLHATALVLLVALASGPLLGGPPGKTRSEKILLGKIASEWITLGRWCVPKKMGEQAKLCVKRAEAADAGAKGLGSLKEKAKACEDAPTETDLKVWKRKVESAGKKAASNFEKLYRLGSRATDPSDQARFEGYLWASLEASPSAKRWSMVLATVQKAVAGKEAEKGLRLANRALSLKPPAKFVSKFKWAVDRAATDRLVLMTASSHPMRYYFSLPKKFQRIRNRKWPVLVCVEGAGSNFEGIARGYGNRRGDLPFMIVSPCSFSNTNRIEGKMREKYRKYYSDEAIDDGNKKRIDWDEEGLLAVLKDLRENFDAEERCYVTGFSGGGNITYMMIFKHPDMLGGAAPACANFSGRGAGKRWKADWKFTAEDMNFPIHMITGENDPHRDYTHGNKNSPGIEPQTDWAEEALKVLGYPNTRRTMIPGMKHSAAHTHVIETFKPYWEGRKKRADRLD